MKKFLVCAPDNFAVTYEINAWMDNQVGRVNQAVAQLQWKNFVATLQAYNNTLHVIENQPVNVPDLVFTANAGLVFKKSVLLTHFTCSERQPEEVIYARAFEELGLKVDKRCIDDNIHFEGAGDALFHHNSKTLVLANGTRTQSAALGVVRDFVKNIDESYNVLQVNLATGSFYHIDTCFCPLDNGMILWFPAAFDASSQEKITAHFGENLIAADAADAAQFCCNAVSVGEHLFMSRASVQLKDKMRQVGINIVETPLYEFLLSGGSAKCLTLEV